MGRLNRFELMLINKEKIVSAFRAINKNILMLSDVSRLLDNIKLDCSLPGRTSVSNLLQFLQEQQILEEVIIKLPTHKTTRYLFGNPSVYEIALSIRKQSYLTHYTSLFLHDLTDNVTKNIYTNVEQYDKQTYAGELEQKNIDLAFSRPMRKTNQIAYFERQNISYQVYLLNGKNHHRLAVSEFELNGITVSVTNIERTLIDIVVRPDYAGGVQEVLNAYVAAKGRFSVNKLVATLKKMDYTYPYHQLIGFYMEKAGYKEDLLRLLEQLDITYDFYLTYQMKDKAYSARWKTYYPKGLV